MICRWHGLLVPQFAAVKVDTICIACVKLAQFAFVFAAYLPVAFLARSC